MANTGLPEYIPINFFLFNKIKNGVDYLLVDELVFQALTSPPDKRFDKLALFAFNFSYAGRWGKARENQRRPALWAFHYVKDRVSKGLNWQTRKISADDIEDFVTSDGRYTGSTSRKLSTNLNYLYRTGGLKEYPSAHIERWWVDALFLALDRLIEDSLLDGRRIDKDSYTEALLRSSFVELTGPTSLEKQLAIPHLVRLYVECGGRERFSDEQVEERTRIRVKDIAAYIANDEDPRAAVHLSNPRIQKTIPQACAMLAMYAGFKVLTLEELENFDIDDFIRRNTQDAIDALYREQIRPTLSAEQLMRMTRGG
jgi:hypothetical protein